MNQIALALEDSIYSVGCIPADLTHPWSVGCGSDARDINLARRQLDEPSPCPYFHCEEIRRHNQFPVLCQELLPGRLPNPLWCRFDPMSFENLCDRTGGKLVSQIG